jgi:hypothetical protein
MRFIGTFNSLLFGLAVEYNWVQVASMRRARRVHGPEAIASNRQPTKHHSKGMISDVYLLNDVIE